MAKYLKENSEVLEAFMFSYLKLDEFFKEFGGISDAIIFRLSAEEKSVEISFPFEEQESIKAFSGDYLVRGEEIPEVFLHAIAIMLLAVKNFVKSSSLWMLKNNFLVLEKQKSYLPFWKHVC